MQSFFHQLISQSSRIRLFVEYGRCTGFSCSGEGTAVGGGSGGKGGGLCCFVALEMVTLSSLAHQHRCHI